MNVKINIEIEDDGKTVEVISGETVYNGMKFEKTYVNSSSIDRDKTKDIIKEICDTALKIML